MRLGIRPFAALQRDSIHATHPCCSFSRSRLHTLVALEPILDKARLDVRRCQQVARDGRSPCCSRSTASVRGGGGGTVVAPLLKKHGFGGTFFVTEGFDFPTNKRDTTLRSWGRHRSAPP